jgi:hypothetical protein
VVNAWLWTHNGHCRLPAYLSINCIRWLVLIIERLRSNE